MPLRIAAVHSVQYGDEAWELQESFERDHIQLRPGPRFGSSSLAGWEPPEGFTYDTQMLFLELEPAPEAERAAAGPASAEAGPTAIELSPDARLLHSLCRLLEDTTRKAGWDLELKLAAPPEMRDEASIAH